MRSSIFFILLLIGVGVGAQPADTVIKNGEIYTVNEVQPWVQALAIKNKRIVFAGRDSAVEKYVGKETEVIDLKGSMAMPGIHDAHIHMMSGGMTALGCSIPTGSMEEAVADALKECAGKLGDGEWLVAGKFFVEQFPGNVPHKKYLDELFPDRPVYLFESTLHNGLANSKALEIAGVDETTKAPDGGDLILDENGLLTGELIETATALVRRVIPSPTPEKRVKALRKAIQVANQYGITSVQDATVDKEFLTALKRIDEDGDLSLHVTGHIIWENDRHSKKKAGEIMDLINNRANFQSEHIDPNAIKIWLDGTPTAPYFTAADLDPETGEPEMEMLLIPPEILNEHVAKFDAMGMKIKIHASGAGGAHVVLDAYEQARKKNPDSNIRHELGHTNLIAVSDMDRLRKLNVVADLSPSVWHIYGETLGDPPQRAWQFRTLSNKGALISVGTDWDVANTPNVFPALEGMLFFGDESLDLISAVRTLTLNGALSIGREEDVGSLEEGKLANLVVLDRNIFAIDPRDIGDTVVKMTVFEGEVVFSK